MSTEKARLLRKNQTPHEALLWKHLRNRRFKRVKFRRQVPIGRYIVDFVSMKHKLIIELDGGQHMANRKYDAQRTAFLNESGYRVIRFWNNQVTKDLDGVLKRIEIALENEDNDEV